MKTAVSRYPLQVMGREITVETPLIGRHQLRNVALAIAAAEELGRQGFPVTAESIERGIRETNWPGRFQVLPAAGLEARTSEQTRPNMCSTWRIILPGHGLCARPSLLVIRGGRSRLFLEPCGTRR